MTAIPEVSIVIPTRNRWSLLAAHALPSALGQEDVAIEVVVVDDGSTDQTAARLAELKDARLRVLQPRASRGLAAARNAGIADARGEWVAFLDDDDLWSPRKLRAQLDAADGAGWVYGAAVVVDERKNVLEAHPFPDPAEVAALLLSGGNVVPGGGSNVIVRADLLRRVGGFDESLRFFEDWDLWLRLARESRAAACPDVVVARVEHGHNMLFRDRPDVMLDLERLLGKHREVTDRDRQTIAEWVALEHFRGGKRLRAGALYFEVAVRFRSPGNVPPAVGALAGEKGIRLASRLLRTLRGSSHLDEVTERVLASEPAWLDRFRSPAHGLRATARKL